MSLYVCEECGCIENTALSNYWYRKNKDMFDDNRALCSECQPTHFKTGERASLGKWHNKFPKEHWSKRYDTKPEGHF